MTDFKGTKTKWQRSENSIGFVYALKENEVENAFSFNINNDGHLSDEEISANSLLISKAPEMLKALKTALILINDNYGNFKNEIQQLIEEATNI